MKEVPDRDDTRDSATICGTATLTRGEGGSRGKKLKIWGWLNNFVTDCSYSPCFFLAKVLKEKSPSLVYYVIPVAIALSVLLLVVLILLVYIKHRKKGDPADKTVQVPVDNTLSVNTVPVNTVIVSKEEIGAPRVPGPLDKVSSSLGMLLFCYHR